MAMKPSSVVSRIRSTLIPSTPKRYWTPMRGIQASLLHELEAGGRAGRTRTTAAG